MGHYAYEAAVRAALTKAPGASEKAPREPVLWDRLSWPKLAALRDTTNMVLLPTGAIEQHGPHLPINTDVAIASGVCLYASASTGVPMLPCIPYTNSLAHTDHWPGTISSTPHTLIAQVREITDWVLRSGFRRLLIVNAHYGNDAPLRCAIDYLRTEHRGKLMVGMRNTWALSREAGDFYQKDGVDIHANRAETSLMLALDPEAVGDIAADDPDRTEGHVFTWPVADTSLNGVTGRPSEATREEGLSMLSHLGEALAELVRRAQQEAAPLTQRA